MIKLVAMDGAVAEEIVKRFANVWAAPSRAAFGDMLHEDVVLSAPLMARTRGKTAGLAALDAMLALWPDVRGDIGRWGATADGVIIEWTLHGQLGRRPVRIPITDRLSIVDQLIVERVAYFDPLPLLAAVARQPRLWRLAVATMRPRRA